MTQNKMTQEQMMKMMQKMQAEGKLPTTEQMKAQMAKQQGGGQVQKPVQKKPVQKQPRPQQQRQVVQHQNMNNNGGGSKAGTILSIVAIVMSVIAIGVSAFTYMSLSGAANTLKNTLTESVTQNLQSISDRVDTLSTDLSTYQFNNDQAVSDIKTTVDDMQSSVSNIEGKMKYEVETIEPVEMTVESKTSTYTGPDSMDYSPVDNYEEGSKVTVTGKVTTYNGAACEWYRTSNGDFIDGSKLEAQAVEETTEDEDADTAEKEEDTKKEEKSSKKKG